jgi:hypothetical protein
MNEIERQTKFETDALQDGILRYCQSREYAVATDSKPVRNVVAESLKPLAEAILQKQLALKAPGSQKLPQYGEAGERCRINKALIKREFLHFLRFGGKVRAKAHSPR